MTDSSLLQWHKVLDLPGLEEGRVTTVTGGTTSIALSRFQGPYGPMEPHRACAIRCISGGIPLALPHVALPVKVPGTVVDYGRLKVIRVDPAAIQRLEGSGEREAP